MTSPRKKKVTVQRQRHMTSSIKSRTLVHRLKEMMELYIPRNSIPVKDLEKVDKGDFSVLPQDKLASYIKTGRGLVREVLGTQQPILRLRSIPCTITAASSLIASAIPVDPNGVCAIIDWSSWKAVFDEYRIHRVRVMIINEFGILSSATASATALNWCAFGVDYDDVVAPGSLSSVICLDTFKLIPLVGEPSRMVHELLVQPEGQPDLAWVTTATTTQPACVKAVNGNATAGNIVYYSVIMEYEIEFRQVD